MRKSNAVIIDRIKAFILIDKVEDKYKENPGDFTRARKLPFKLLVLFMLRKLYKSLALEISDFFKELEFSKCFLTKSAFSQSRQNLLPVYFEDLVHKFNDEFYTDNQERVRQLGSMRILAVDGSTLDLPYSQELVQVYGTHSNQYDTVRYVKARISVLYDLLNGIIIDGVLQAFAEGEPTAALKHIQYCHRGDLLVYDRGYASFDMVYTHKQEGLHVLMRMKPSFSNQIRAFVQSQANDAILTMQPNKDHPIMHKAYNKEAQVEVRLVKFKLDNGEQALLLTTLLDERDFPIALLKQVYGMRWGVETQYDVLKNVLQVEYFSGYTQKAILQDFYISLFLMNMQALLTDELQQEIQAKYAHRKYTYQVNTAMAIGYIKKSIVALFVPKQTDEILAELKESFLAHVEPVRPGRKYPRHKDKYRTRKKPILMKNRKNIL